MPIGTGEPKLLRTLSGEPINNNVKKRFKQDNNSRPTWGKITKYNFRIEHKDMAFVKYLQVKVPLYLIHVKNEYFCLQHMALTKLL